MAAYGRQVTALWVVAIVALAASSGDAQQGVPYVIRDTAAPCLSIRPAPDIDADRFDCLAPGLAMTVLESVPYWRKIALTDGRVGWVRWDPARLYVVMKVRKRWP
jgi:SH3-like domain-containing protein